ncbi:MAG: hypothetical protein JST92_09900 [Deltaproteobacteria bacterium]|nr:hypothetical protein [Deltaproteobacteria bacterium]
MSYPFVPRPKWRDLRLQLEREAGCTFVPAPHPRIQRVIDNVILFYPIALADTERVSLMVLRSILRRLKLPLAQYGVGFA